MKASSFFSLLVNPFTRIGGWKAFFIGLVIFLVTAAVGYLGDAVPVGLFSIRPIADVSISTILICQASTLAVLVLIIYLTAFISTRHVRFQDVLGITTLAQAPLLLVVTIVQLLIPIVNSVIGFTKKGDVEVLNQIQSASTYLFVSIVGLVVVAVLIWYVVVLYNGFKTLTDLKGTKGVIAFIGLVIVLGNILSMLLISLLTCGSVKPFVLS